MRICILTQPLHTNYGGLLQAYALQTVLKRMGHEVLTEDRKPNRPSAGQCLKNNIKSMIKAALIHCPFQHRFTRFNHIPPSQLPYIRQHTDRFIRKYISTTEPVCTNDKPMFRSYGFEAYVVGSDQVWRPMYSPCISNYFLDFTKGEQVKRVAYAASFGTEDWEYTDEQIRECADLVRHFDAVSVREASGIKLCEKYLHTSAVHVLDPTMLLEIEDYKLLVRNEKEPQSAGNLFCYILDAAKEKQDVIGLVSDKCHLTPFTSMPKPRVYTPGAKFRVEDYVFPPVTRWLRAFMDAEMVVTDSFHGCVFSIIFNKPFWVIGNKERGMARFLSLLSMFGLEERLIEPQNLQNIDWQMPIDWNAVNEHRKAWQKISFDFLNRNLTK